MKTAAPQQPFQQARVAIALDAKTNGGRDPLKGSESDVHRQSNKVQEAKETNNHTLLGFQLEISGGRASSLCMLLISDNVNFCRGLWALLRRSRVVRRCLRVPANGSLLPLSIPTG